MYQDLEKLNRIKEVLRNLSSGVNPIDGGDIDQNILTNNEEIIESLSYGADLVERQINFIIKKGQDPKKDFVITEEEKSRIMLPNKNIGITEFARMVNQVIDLKRSKKLSAIEINRQLRKMGLLDQEKLDDKRYKTVTNDKSHKYGIQSEKRVYKDTEYEMITFNNIGKKYLLENLEKIMSYEEKKAN